LAALSLDRARETGSFADLERAEGAARESLGLRTAHNAATFALLASILMAQHRFAEALRAAERADAMEPGVVSHRALIGEISLELGDYGRARALFDSLRHEPLTDVASLRLARWYELSGRSDWAARQLVRVAAEWERHPDAPHLQLAWLHLRLSELAMKDGRLAGADSALRAGFVHAPNDYRLLGAASRLAARRGRWRESIVWGERAIAVSLEPTTLGVLSDAYAAIGDSLRSAEYATILRTVALSQPGFPHRAWSLWMLDHDRSVPQVLRRAREELETRKDIYGYDLYAWALHKAGRDREAWNAMQQALRLGTKDPLLARHAAAIHGTLGDSGAQ
jgi:tetratricopeptide (TPR) repeat protein